MAHAERSIVLVTQTNILQEIQAILKAQWTTRDGQKVPDTDDISLANDALKLEGTVLYADMVDSTLLVNGYKNWFAAEVYKSYLIGACRAIRVQGGEITAFDGDRVMAVFIGNSKNTSAAKAALNINYIVREINRLLKEQYPNSTYQLRQAVGVDTSTLFIARTGIRNANDLVWIGRAANYAAKLCSLCDASYPTYITEEVYHKLAQEAKYGGEPRCNMWEKRIWTELGLPIYRSNWWWKL
jgi:class 3 adenylate cyclase